MRNARHRQILGSMVEGNLKRVPLELPDFPYLPHAACASDPNADDWFLTSLKPSSERRDNQKRTAAIALCNVCIEQAACLEWALDHDEQDGIWGGLLPHERKELRR